MSRRRLDSAAGGLLLATLTACGASPGYRPVTPLAATGRAATFAVESIDRDTLLVRTPDGAEGTSGLLVRLRWHALTAGTGLARAFLAPREAAPCTAGVAAELIEIDGQTRWDRPVGLGTDHAVAFGFPQDEPLEAAPLMLDVEMADAAGASCVRVPLTGGAQRYAPPSQVAVGAAGVLSAPLRRNTSSAFAIDFAAGRWLGPLRLTLRFGIGVALSHLSTGDGDDSDDSNASKPGFVDLHLAPELAFLPWASRDHAFGVSVSYVVGSGTAGAGTPTDPERDTDFSGPRVAVLLGAVQPAPLGASPRHPDRFLGAELSLFRATVWPGQPTRGAAYVLGLGMVIW